PLVGRDAELDLLENTFGRCLRDRRAHLFTIYGDPGVGKSRLTREFASTLEGATVLAGRCLPYGEGITYWPLAEMVKSAAGIDDDDDSEEALEKLRASCEVEAVADLLGLASGILAAVEGERSREELAWAARAWAQSVAEVQPLELVLEKTEGNPLFVEETIRMLVEEDGRPAGLIPDTLQALIAARIDRLEPPQKTLLQRASVMGRIFWPSAVERLAPDLEGLDRLLDDLL